MFCYFPVWSTHKNFSDINWALQPVIEDKKHMLKISVVGILFLYLECKISFLSILSWGSFCRVVGLWRRKSRVLGPDYSSILDLFNPKKKKKSDKQSVAWNNLSYKFPNIPMVEEQRVDERFLHAYD